MAFLARQRQHQDDENGQKITTPEMKVTAETVNYKVDCNAFDVLVQPKESLEVEEAKIPEIQKKQDAPGFQSKNQRLL